MSNLIIWLLMVLGGACLAVQPAVNARLAERTGLLEAALISFLVGTAGLVAVLLVSGNLSLKGAFRGPAWELSGGLYGAIYVTVVTLAVPRLGVTAALTTAIASQLIVGLAMDHFGWCGIPQTSLDSRRLMGVLLLMAGVWLVRR